MIYFDNAATGGFKPSAATEAAVTTIKYLKANPGRSGHRLSVRGAETVENTRLTLASMFGAPDPDRVIFTKNATEALNTLLLGTAKRGGHIITTVYEHNSVLRPLAHLKSEYGVTCTFLDGEDLYSEIKAAINENTYLVIINHVSNVTGKEQDLAAAAKAIEGTGIMLAVDAAQSAGHTEINISELKINALCSAGHKGMCGIMGSGFLIFDTDTEINPITFGGTGTESLSETQPEFYPERLESGTLNLPAIAALGEAAIYVKNNLRLFGETLFTLTDALIDELNHTDNVKVYSKPNKYGIVSFSVAGYGSGEVADILSREYDVAVRGGLHCAPLIHKKLGTEETGLVRASLAPQNTLREVYAFVKAVRRIASGMTFY